MQFSCYFAKTLREHFECLSNEVQGSSRVVGLRLFTSMSDSIAKLKEVLQSCGSSTVRATRSGDSKHRID